MYTKSLIVIFTLIVITTAEVVHHQNCHYPEGTKINCTIHEVRVNPCKEAEHHKPCRIKRGENASISFDYTAYFHGDSLESRAYWANQVIDLPFLGMETNACATTTCPVQSGQKQTYTITLPIAKTYPARTFDVKWKLWNPQEQECCFIFQIKLHK
ncbi:MD-2-related lipid-recognition protein-like [Chelonus insularis]|uniref:MD-2-related lipid-recognition protein-like n=1 Tax=Chelonus insularis TaxID=460826 RepID=UPI00158B5A38|nr:MD-2-related lipid-recognition protein-like [Chelonus insularis]